MPRPYIQFLTASLLLFYPIIYIPQVCRSELAAVQVLWRAGIARVARLAAADLGVSEDGSGIRA